MAGRHFRLFILCSIIVIGIGIYISIAKETTKFPVSPDNPVEYHDVKGWHIIVIGLVMLLLGLVLKKVATNRSDKNSLGNLNTNE